MKSLLLYFPRGNDTLPDRGRGLANAHVVEAAVGEDVTDIYCDSPSR